MGMSGIGERYLYGPQGLSSPSLWTQHSSSLSQGFFVPLPMAEWRVREAS